MITGVTDSTLFTFYSLQYTDDGNIEYDVDENDIRLQVVNTCTDDEQAITKSVTLDLNIDDRDDVKEDHHQHHRRPIARTVFSADDLSLLPPLRGRGTGSEHTTATVTLTSSPTPIPLQSEAVTTTTPTTSTSAPTATTLMTSCDDSLSSRHRRWSFESSPASAVPVAVPVATTAPGVVVPVSVAQAEAALQLKRQQRFASEDPHLFSPLAARCVNTSCRRLTVFRCQRCNQSFSCSVACQQQVEYRDRVWYWDGGV